VTSEAVTPTGQDTKPVPTPQVDSQPFWAATRDGQLRLQRCAACGRFQFPPRLICSHCGSVDVVWKPVVGTGHIYSFTIVQRPPTPAFAQDVPYVVALVDLDEGPRMMTNVIGCEPTDVHVSMRVRARFVPREDQTLVMFECEPS
jgi:uncharacterized protein